jgi:hypothetical protein
MEKERTNALVPATPAATTTAGHAAVSDALPGQIGKPGFQ